MKNIFSCTIAILAFSFSGTAQVKMPALSPTQIIKQDFGTGFIEITYSRPAMKGRKIFGDLVPFGKIWRTGANEATRIFFSEPVEIGGKNIDSGAYVLYTIPDVDSWEIILNKGLNNWGTNGYKKSDDLFRFKVTADKIKSTLESFTIDFSDVKPTSCLLHLKWEKTDVPVLIAANFKSKLKAEIEAAMQTDKKPFWEAAQFYYEYDKNLSLALDHVTHAIEANKSAFWMWIYKANIQKDMGDKAGAMESSNKSLVLAEAAKNDDYVKMNKDLQKRLK